ncbi:hypothetical protein [Klebsiella pneumoniae]|uniref:hypothetical protein n=1 Tax=Klebsiella pneumoniae TaxID=573 RepID=UPI00177C490B|nr:hypothetical protein [Klebsiella pneumoniae]MBD8431262.1 hypothetical protein [Klebsiella pneumoniae]HBR2305007.1 hypothetical protein [Klebsiella pneumoniae]HBW4093973.1 hypothetical protein [Klebsiella pneumoniae]
MNIETVNELIQSLESAGELSIGEQKFLKLAKEFRICSASLDAAIKTGNMLADQNAQLAAENVALKDLARGWANATDDRLFEEFGEISHDSIDDCEAELKIICPATDRIVAGIKADGVEMFALMFAEEAIKDNNITSGWKVRASRAASEYAELLREGAK